MQHTTEEGTPNGAQPHSTAQNGQPPNGTTNGYPDAHTGAEWRGELSPKHRQTLEVESAISLDAIEARGISQRMTPTFWRSMATRKHGVKSARW